MSPPYQKYGLTVRNIEAGSCLCPAYSSPARFIKAASGAELLTGKPGSMHKGYIGTVQGGVVGYIKGDGGLSDFLATSLPLGLSARKLKRSARAERKEVMVSARQSRS